AVAVARTAAGTALLVLVLADALHHLAARRLGRGVEHLARGRAALAAPQHLAAHGDRLGLLAGGGAEALDHLRGDVLLGEAFDLLHEAFFVQAHQRHRLAFAAGAAGAADAVHVV